jgi:glycosyltransferase involved in cell wall biosynthesis
MPFITVIIPVFNTASFLAQCLTSIINQQFRDIEIIVVDDYSTDDSIRIVEFFATQDDRISIIKHSANCGAGAARNTGIKRSKGNYILFLDSDDYLFDKSSLLKLSVIAKKVDPEIILFKHKILNPDTNELYDMIDDNEKNIWKHIAISVNTNKLHTLNDFLDFLNTPAYPWNKLIKRKFLIENKINCTETFCHNDLALSWKAMVTAQRFAFLAEDIVVHRRSLTHSQLTNDKSRRRLDLFIALADVNDFLQHKIPLSKIYIRFIKFKWKCFSWGIKNITPDYHHLFSQLIKNDLKNTPISMWILYLINCCKKPQKWIAILLLLYCPSLFVSITSLFRKPTQI